MDRRRVRNSSGGSAQSITNGTPKRFTQAPLYTYAPGASGAVRPSDPRKRRRQTGDLAARAKDRAAARRVGSVVGADHVKVAQVGSPEAEARHGARRHLETCVRRAVRQVALYRACQVEGDPDPALGVYREAVGAALDADGRLGRGATGRVELVNEHACACSVGVVDRATVRCEADAVGERDSAVELRRRVLRIDPPALAGDALALELEGIGLHRPGVHASLGVGEQVVEAGRIVTREQDACRAVLHVTDVLARDHEPTIRVQRDASDTAALGHDDLDGAVRSPAVHPAIRDVAEVEHPGAVDPRALDQPVPVGERFELHATSIYIWSGPPLAWLVTRGSSTIRMFRFCSSSSRSRST